MDKVFRQLKDPVPVRLQVAISPFSTLMELSKSWAAKANCNLFPSRYSNQRMHPTELSADALKQLDKVYSNCIHPSQYLPQLFTNENATSIFQCGSHVSENSPNLQSLHKAYPLTKRPSNTASTTTVQSIIKNSVCSVITSCPSNSPPPVTPVPQTHLRDYNAYLLSGATLNDGVTNISVNCIVAAQPPRMNGNPWFAKVTNLIDNDSIEVRWLHSSIHASKYYYMEDTPDVIPTESIICNGVEFEPVFAETLLWRLLTPLPFIARLNTDQVTTLAPAIAIPSYSKRKKNVDITSLVFSNRLEFEKYIYSIKDCKYLDVYTSL
jgi:hypothetical protein